MNQTWLRLLAVLIALEVLIHVHADDLILQQCKRPGWIFLHRVQQKSWQAILQCTEMRQPWAACDEDPNCIGFTSNGGQSNGWTYRLPRVKACGSPDDLKSLAWEFKWAWIPMDCKDAGPCCGTYLANTAGVDPAFLLSCGLIAGTATEPLMPNCPNTKCPTLHTTHRYSSIGQWEVDCKQQINWAQQGTRHRALLGSTNGGGFQSGWSKRNNPRSTRKVALATIARSSACDAASDFCGDL